MQNLSPAEVAARADCVFSCLPHGVSASLIPALLDGGSRVVDFSADYRLDDGDVFQHGTARSTPTRSGWDTWPTGCRSCSATRFARPTWWPTRAAFPRRPSLPLAPLLKAGLIEPKGIIVDSKSGVSGAGRTPKLITHYPECNESIAAYNIGRHRHTPEIDQILGIAGGTESK